MNFHSRVLVVDDDPAIRDAVRIACESEGYEVDEAASGQDALTHARAFHPDLILLDLMLPDVSGYAVCRDIRADGIAAPILILSAKDEEIDVVVGLEMGADDYIAKPFRPRELLARIAAHLRKERGPVTPAADAEMHFGDLVIDVATRLVQRSGSRVDLTDTEFDVLHYLASEAGKALSRETIIDAVWGPNQPTDQRALDVHIRNLRTKIESDPAHPDYILAVRGLGYRFVPPPK